MPRRRSLVRLPLFLLLLLLPLPLVACSASSTSSDDSVIASFYPLQFVTQRILGDTGTVGSLTKPGIEPHDLELSVKQVGDVSAAGVVVYEGGLQPAVDAAVNENASSSSLDVSDAAQLEGDDPHFWLDPARLSGVASAIEKRLASTYPNHASTYTRNLEVLQKDLAALDSAFKTGLENCKQHTIVVSHDAFGYWRKYGLDIEGIAGLSPDNEPSPAHLAQLQDLIKTRKITTVFSETLGTSKLADALSRELDISSTVLDPIEGLAGKDGSADYLSIMRKNLSTLRKVNLCQ